MLMQHGFQVAGFCGLREYGGQKIHPNTDEQAIRQTYRTIEAAVRNGDVQGLTSQIDEPAIFVWDQEAIVGRAALEAAFVENMATVWKGSTTTNTIHGVELLSSDVAIAWGRYDVVLGDGAELCGRFMNTLQKQGSRWLIMSEQTSSRPACE